MFDALSYPSLDLNNNMNDDGNNFVNACSSSNSSRKTQLVFLTVAHYLHD
jgi:hypothetical protein